jgi:hypothetical protein
MRIDTDAIFKVRGVRYDTYAPDFGLSVFMEEWEMVLKEVIVGKKPPPWTPEENEAVRKEEESREIRITQEAIKRAETYKVSRSKK